MRKTGPLFSKLFIFKFSKLFIFKKEQPVHSHVSVRMEASWGHWNMIPVLALWLMTTVCPQWASGNVWKIQLWPTGLFALESSFSRQTFPWDTALNDSLKQTQWLRGCGIRQTWVDPFSPPPNPGLILSLPKRHFLFLWNWAACLLGIYEKLNNMLCELCTRLDKPELNKW